MLGIFATRALAGESRFQWAAGTALGWMVRQEYGSRTFNQFAPEVVAYGYFPLAGSWWLRPGARVGYRWMQPDMPSALRIEERDTVMGLDLGVLYQWKLVFSLAAGGQLMNRSSHLTTSAPVDAGEDLITRRTWLKGSYLQGGVGYPALGGIAVFEPLLRWMFMPEDWRGKFFYGMEITFGVK